MYGLQKFICFILSFWSLPSVALQIPEACATESLGKSQQQRGQSVFVMGASVLMELARGKKNTIKKTKLNF